MTLVVTLPNALTLLRILAVPFFGIFVWYGRMSWAFAIFVLAGVTDLLDGWVARVLNQRSSLGAILDPAADKLLMTTAFVLMAIPQPHLVVTIPVWVSILGITRDVVITFVALMSAGRFEVHRFSPSILGKVTTGTEVVVVALALLLNALGPGPWVSLFSPWIFWVVAGMVLASGIHYFLRATSEPVGV